MYCNTTVHKQMPFSHKVNNNLINNAKNVNLITKWKALLWLIGWAKTTSEI